MIRAEDLGLERNQLRDLGNCGQALGAVIRRTVSLRVNLLATSSFLDGLAYVFRAGKESTAVIKKTEDATAILSQLAGTAKGIIHDTYCAGKWRWVKHGYCDCDPLFHANLARWLRSLFKARDDMKADGMTKPEILEALAEAVPEAQKEDLLPLFKLAGELDDIGWQNLIDWDDWERNGCPDLKVHRTDRRKYESQI